MFPFLQQVRVAARALRRTPSFTLVIVATLALGIGANAAIFSVINGILLRPLPFGDPDRIVGFEAENYSVSEPEFMDYRRDLHGLEGLAAYRGDEGNLTGGTEPEHAVLAQVSWGFFGILGVQPLLGRTFTPDEEAPSQAPAPTVIISHGLWQRYFGRDPKIIGRTIQLNGVARTVVGVMKPGFNFPSPEVALWLPLRLNPDSLWTRNNHYLQLVGRLAAGADMRRVDAEAKTLALRWNREYPDIYPPNRPLRVNVRPLADTLVGSTRPYLLALLGAVGFVLLIACANVANLLLARGEGRRKELGIRSALGASGRHVIGQVLTESLVLAAAGGILGLGLAWGGSRALVAIAPSALPRLEEVRLDGWVVLFTALLSLCTGILFGLLPAIRAARSDSLEVLKAGGKTSATHGGERARRSLVVSEVALAVILLAGTALLIQSLRALQQVDLGFDPTHLLTGRVNLPPNRYRDDASAVAFVNRLEERLRTLPGVKSAATMGWTPIIGGRSSWSIHIDGQIVHTTAEAPAITPQQVTPDYFRTMGIKLVRGRTFTDADRADAPLVLIANETMARQLWPGQNPIGHTIKMYGDSIHWATVVGVVGNIKSSGVQRDPPPTMFFPYAQAGLSAYYTPRSVTMAIKTNGNPNLVAGVFRAAVRELDASVPVSSVITMEEVVGTALIERRFTTLLLGGFAALAVLLAGIGIYGVTSYGVSQRTYEIGLRMALGAEQKSVLALIVLGGLRLTLLGVAIGLAGAVAVGRLIRSMLVDVTIADPLTLVLVAAALVGVAALAAFLPARRASAVSPTEALKG